MAEQLKMEAWYEARKLFERWEALTGEIGVCVEQGELEKLASLLAERQLLCDRLDALKTANGIASWTEELCDQDLTPEMLAIREGLHATILQLAAEDVRIQLVMQDKSQSLKGKVIQLRQTRNANQAYLGRHKPNWGAFIDTKK